LFLVPEAMELEASKIAPEFTKPLQACKAKEGTTASLECAVAGTPLPKVTWLKNGVEVVPNENVRIDQFDDGRQKLTILEASPDDIGQYHCVAVNEAGKAETGAKMEGTKFLIKFLSNFKSNF
jgi:hypothetical protein